MTFPRIALYALPIVLAVPAAPFLLGAVDDSGDATVSATSTFKLVDSGATGSELNVGLTSNGCIFVGGWNVIRRSCNDGATWTSQPHMTGVSFAADRALITDHDTDRVFVSDTYLGCTILSWSDDLGAKWQTNPVACGGGVTDHQKAGVGKRTTLADPTGTLYRNVIYVCANGLAATNCGASADGGLTFLPTNQHGVGCAFQGAPVADRSGVLYEPTTQCGAQIRKTADNGLRWTTLPIANAGPSSDTPDVAITPDGTLYFMYSTSDWKPAVMRSTNGGMTWTGPYLVPVTGIRSTALPAIVAGDDGRIALSFYGTTDAPSSWNGNPGDAPDGVKWNGYVAIAIDAAAATLTFDVVQVNAVSDPFQIGAMTKLGGTLSNIADYMDIDVGPDGRVYAVFTDGCLAGCTNHATSDDQNAIVAIQTNGAVLKA